MDTTMASENFDHTVSSLKDGVAAATAGTEKAQAALQDGIQKAMKSAEEAFAFSQGNIEAFTKSSQILASGIQDMTQTLAAATRTSMDETMGLLKAMSGVKSIKDAMDLQSKLVRSAMEKAVLQTGQMTDSTMKLSEQAFAPIGARLSLAAEKFGRIG